MTTHFSSRGDGAPMKCEARVCRNPATHVYVWRSPRMAAPAFWYGCEAEVTDWLAKGARTGMIAHIRQLAGPR